MRTVITKRRLSVAALTMAAVVALTGCSVTTGASSSGPSSEAKTNGLGDDGVFKVAAFSAGYATPGGKLSMDAFVKAGNEQENWDVKLYTSTFDYDKINSDVQTAIQQGADAILAGFPDPRQIAPLVQASKEAGIPIFSIDGGVKANDDFVVDTTFSQEVTADLTVGALEEAMGGLEGKDVMVIGHDPHVGIQTRSNLALEKLKGAGANIAGGGMKQALDPGTGRTEALNFVTDYLQANPNGLDGVWVGWDDAALGAARAITEAGRDDIFVTGVDALGETAVEIAKNGPMYASVAQDWIKVVDQTIDLMNDYRDSAKLPEINFVPLDGELIDRSNVATYKPTL